MSHKTTRLVKLQRKLHPRIKDWKSYKQAPCLSISGVWIEQAGFKPGDQVEITIENEKPIITNTGGHGDQNN